MKIATGHLILAALLWLIPVHLAAARQSVQTVFGSAEQEFEAEAASISTGEVSLPFVFRDDQGNNWQVRQDGTTGRPELFPNDGYGKIYTSQGATFPDFNQAQWDASRNELVLGPGQMQGVSVTRFLRFDKKNCYCRYVDLYENAGGSDARLNLADLYFKVFGGVHLQKRVLENAALGNATAVVVGGQNIFTGLVGAGRSSLHPPEVLWEQQGVSFKWDMIVPANGCAALMHIQIRRPGVDDVVEFLKQTPDADFLKDLPAKAVGHVVNFDVAAVAAGSDTVITHIGKYELPRGDKLDLVDLRGGDHCKGTITETSYRIQTPYGLFEIPAQNVAGIISLSPSGTRQLLVTTDGQALAGRLEKPSIAVQLAKEGTGSGGQTIQIPVTDMLHLGYRPRAEEHEPSADRPTVFLRSGDILALAAPEGTVRLVTRYGALELPLQHIASLVLDSDENGLHVVHLTDGSHFGAILQSDQLPLRLKLLPVVPATRPDTGATANGEVRFGPGTISRVIFSSKIDPLDAAPILKLANDDLLVGTLQGQLKLDTSLDTLNVDPARIVHLTHTGEGPEAELHVSFSDDTQFSGQLESPLVECRLLSGASLQVPVDQLREFIRPRALDKPPATQPAK